MFSNKEIERYYDLTEFHYRLHWNLKQSRSLHYGYWDETTRNFHEALLNINKVLSQKASITNRDHVLDAGCGIGGSSLWLAAHLECRVTGIALNEKQLVTARGLAEEEGLQYLVDFQRADFTQTTFADNTFDVVWAIESVCHAPEKINFLKEAHRLLKPGGCLIMCDYFKKSGLTTKENNIILKWVNGWAINDIPVIDLFIRDALHAGFASLEIEDASKAIAPSARRMAKAYYIGMVPSFLYNLFHRNVSSHGKNNVRAAYFQYKGLKKQLWKYKIIYAVKK